MPTLMDVAPDLEPEELGVCTMLKHLHAEVVATPRPTGKAFRMLETRALSLFLALALLSACESKKTPAPAPAALRAIGTILFEERAFVPRDAMGTPDPAAPAPRPDQLKRGIATEIEVLKSVLIAERVARELHADAVQIQQATQAQRRGDSLVVEVSVTDPDSQRAAAICNRVMDEYLTQRMERRAALAADRVMWLDNQIQELKRAGAGKEALGRMTNERTLAELARMDRWSDTRRLDACTAPR